MEEKVIVTIGREFGSGGRLIGRLLAKDLGINYYDKELLTETAKESGYAEEFLEEYDEKTKNLFFSYFLPGEYATDLPLNNKVFLAQFDTMKKLAQNHSAVFIGRCADYILKDFPECVNVFVHAKPEVRIKQIAQQLNLSEDDAKDKIEETDKRRKDYYEYYTGNRWDDLDNYHLCIDSGAISIDGAAELIRSYIEIRQKIKH
ncbi:MAG: AAA family ATPase [Anaerofustis sp.]